MLTDRRGFLNFLGAGTAGAAVIAKADAYPKGATIVEGIGEQELARVKARTPANPTEPERQPCVDVVPWTIYDRIRGQDFDSRGRAAAYTRGCTGRRLHGDTNMWRPYQLDAPQMFHMSRLSFMLDPDNNPADVRRFLSRGSFKLILGQKLYADGPMVLHARASGRIETITVDGGKPTGLAPADSLEFSGPFGLFIDQGQQFHVDLELAAKVSPDFSFWVMMTGLLARGIC